MLAPRRGPWCGQTLALLAIDVVGDPPREHGLPECPVFRRKSRPPACWGLLAIAFILPFDRQFRSASTNSSRSVRPSRAACTFARCSSPRRNHIGDTALRSRQGCTGGQEERPHGGPTIIATTRTGEAPPGSSPNRLNGCAGWGADPTRRAVFRYSTKAPLGEPEQLSRHVWKSDAQVAAPCWAAAAQSSRQPK